MTNPPKGVPLTRIASFTVTSPAEIPPGTFTTISFTPPDFSNLSACYGIHPSAIAAQIPIFARWLASDAIPHPDCHQLLKNLSLLAGAHILIRRFPDEFAALQLPSDNVVALCLRMRSFWSVVKALPEGDPGIRYRINDEDKTITVYVAEQDNVSNIMRLKRKTPAHRPLRQPERKHTHIKPGPKLKTYRFIAPSGEIVEVTDLKAFCKIHGIGYTTMSSLATGSYRDDPSARYRGWRTYTEKNVLFSKPLESLRNTELI